MLSENCYAVIMAGGAGTRLWPLSNQYRPKHLLKFFNNKCLLELTIDKLKKCIPNERIIILTNINHKELTQQILKQIPLDNFIFEPCIRDTASAIGLAATVLQQRCENANIITLTADQIIEPANLFNSAITNASKFLEERPDMLIAFGVKAFSPNTFVGWQQLGKKINSSVCEVRKIIKFTEKPKLSIAQKYMDEGGYCWNSGQFAWKSKTILQEIYKYMPESESILKEIGKAWHTKLRNQTLHKLFKKMPKGSIDYQIMQKTNKACSILLPCTWEDMGTHASIIEKIGTKQKDNRVLGKAIIKGSGNNILVNTNQKLVVAHNDLTIVITDDVIFVGKSNTNMKDLLKDVEIQSPEIL